MEKIVKVTVAYRQSEFSSLLDAVNASASDIKPKKSKVELINGKVVTAYKFNGTVLVICFENDNYLVVSIGEKRVNWNVASTKPNIGTQLDECKVFFQYPNGDKTLWNWKNILDGFIGKQIAISPSEQSLFIFTRGGDEYLFDVLIDVENNNSHFLNLSEV